MACALLWMVGIVWEEKVPKRSPKRLIEVGGGGLEWGDLLQDLNGDGMIRVIV